MKIRTGVYTQGASPATLKNNIVGNMTPGAGGDLGEEVELVMKAPSTNNVAGLFLGNSTANADSGEGYLIAPGDTLRLAGVDTLTDIFIGGTSGDKLYLIAIANV